MFERKLLAAAVILLLGACNAKNETAATAPTQATQGGDAQRGVAAIQKYGCGACHRIPGIPDATGIMGPSLAGAAGRLSADGQGANGPDLLVLWITDPKKVRPGTMMPDLNVSDAEARDIAAYLQTSGR